MPFRYHRRINLGKGLGVNISQSGFSTSYRTKFGSIGSRGFSLKTGIPGLRYWGAFGKNLFPALAIYVIIMIAALIVYNLVRLVFYLVMWLLYNMRWVIMKWAKPDSKNS